MSVTQWFVIGTVAVIVAYDIVALKIWGTKGTISRVLLSASQKRPWGLLIPLAAGVLIGHLFLPQP